MILAVNTGVSHLVWLSDPAAMMTAVRVYEDIARENKRK